MPFPPLLWQEIAALQAQNRFLYNGNQYVPEVALTFDDGPNPYHTPQVLAVLRHYNIKATFFCVGRQVALFPSLVKQEYEAGNIVGNHSWSHSNLALLSSDAILTQLTATSDAIQRATSVRPTFFRPPYGSFNANVLTQVNQLGLTTVMWNDEAHDWNTPGIDVISSRILGLAGNGAIILLHDGGGNRSQTVAALSTIITTLQARGFKFVTLPQLMHDLPVHPASNVAPTSLSMPVYPTPTTVTPTTFNSIEPIWKRGLV
jgi:peptidoglycan/xylan/chitin deacetylase (PgdA/CDA1 family)